MIKKDTNYKTQISLAGEFAVLSQLALHGKDANMTLGNTKGVDILVSDPVTGKMMKLEVKTNYNSNAKIVSSKLFGNILNTWILGVKNEEYDEKKDTNLFYCFVNINKTTNNFKFYIVHSKIVANYLKSENRFWHQEKKNENKKVVHTDMRQFRLGFKNEKYKIPTPIGEYYENNWNFEIK